MRPHAFPVVLAALASLGASYQSRNFNVEAPTEELAMRFAQQAERHRKALAVQWLGREIPQWQQPCSLEVRSAVGHAGGGTFFTFDSDKSLCIDMHIEGPLDQMQNSILPHEVTHAILASHFRRPVPRWADEGSCVLAEHQVERSRHEKFVQEVLNTPGRAIPLRRLFRLRDYPRDVMVLYAEGYSVTRFLVASRDRATFLAFLEQGMDEGWNKAVRTHYGYKNVDALEEAWLESLRRPGKLADWGPTLAREETPAGEVGAPPQPATLIVHLPEDAQLFVDDRPTQSQSGMRRFTTPPLAHDRDFLYTLRAERERDGKLLRVRKTVTVRAGRPTSVTLVFPSE